MEYTIIILLFIVVLYLALKIKMAELEGRVKSMQNTLNRLVNHFNIAESPASDELRELIKKGEDIKAIKKAREEFGLSLIEGKEYIDQLKLTLSEQKS